jgi:hypothetical protein
VAVAMPTATGAYSTVTSSGCEYAASACTCVAIAHPTAAAAATATPHDAATPTAATMADATLTRPPVTRGGHQGNAAAAAAAVACSGRPAARGSAACATMPHPRTVDTYVLTVNPAQATISTRCAVWRKPYVMLQDKMRVAPQTAVPRRWWRCGVGAGGQRADAESLSSLKDTAIDQVVGAVFLPLALNESAEET